MWFIFSFIWSQWLFFSVLAGYMIYRALLAPYDFFDKQNVPHTKPVPLFGSMFNVLFRKESLHELLIKSYNEFKGKRIYGLFEFTRPLYALRDPALIKQITVKDFEHFLDHRPFMKNMDQEPLFGRSLFMLTGQRWRDMRATLSPAFTGSKMRQMFEFVAECSEQATEILLKEVKAAPTPVSYEMKDVFSRYANDVIATSAFGIKVNSLQDRENEFFMMGKQFTNFSSAKIMLKFVIVGILPTIARWMKLRLFTAEQSQFYHDLVHGTMEYREKNNIHRPDMIHLLMEARKGILKKEVTAVEKGMGFATVEEVHADDLRGSEKQVWHDDDLTAQCFLFFLAGFESSSMLLCFTANELMEYPDVQRRLIQEVDEIKEELGGKTITYEVLQKMKYLDMVISETLRKWPPAPVLDRQCVKQYQIDDENGSKITLQKGDGIWIPILGIHRDPEYYSDPDRFDPERFSEERKDSILPGSYLPFGSGPRNCIGSRFALMESKALIYTLLTKFTFEPAPNSTIPLRMAKSGFSAQAENGFNMYLKPRF